MDHQEEGSPRKRHKSKGHKQKRKSRSPPSQGSDDSEEELDEEEPTPQKHPKNAHGHPPPQNAPSSQYSRPPGPYAQPPPPYGYQPPPPPMLPPHLYVPIYPPIPGVPPGLEALQVSKGVGIKQELDLVESFIPIEMKNRYSVLNVLGQGIYFAAEKSGVCARNWYGQNRAFKVILYDGLGREILYIERERTCALAFWGGRIGGSTVTVTMAQTKQLLGTVKQDCGYCTPTYRVNDANGTNLLNIKGKCGDACCSMCSNVKFVVTDLRGTTVSEITRNFKFANFFSDSLDQFGMMYGDGMDARLKAILLGAVICIDFNFFEKSQGIGPCDCTGWCLCQIGIIALVVLGAVLLAIFGIEILGAVERKNLEKDDD